MSDIWGRSNVPNPTALYPQTPTAGQSLGSIFTPANLLDLLLRGRLGNLNNPPRPPGSIPGQPMNITPPAAAAPSPAVSLATGAGGPITQADLAAAGGGPRVPQAGAGLVALTTPGSARVIPRSSPWGPTAPTSFTTTGGIDPAYLDQLARGEGFETKAYHDGRQWSIGYGTPATPEQIAGAPISMTDARAAMTNHVNQAASYVDNFTNKAGVNLNPSQRHALIDLTYNAGPAWIHGAVGTAVRQGNFDQAATILNNGYRTTSKGQYLPGLQYRRDWQASLLRQGSDSGLPPGTIPAGSPQLQQPPPGRVPGGTGPVESLRAPPGRVPGGIGPVLTPGQGAMPLPPLTGQFFDEGTTVT